MPAHAIDFYESVSAHKSRATVERVPDGDPSTFVRTLMLHKLHKERNKPQFLDKPNSYKIGRLESENISKFLPVHFSTDNHILHLDQRQSWEASGTV